MPGNDLTAARALVPQSTDTRAVARANLTTLLTDILDDIEPKVTAAQIDISSDLSFLSGGTKYAATDVAYVGLEDRSADTTQIESVYAKDNELYFHDGAGNKVQLTSGGSAVAGSSGDISGVGYGSPVEINWHSGTAEYRFKKAAGASALADLVMDKARFDDGGGVFATLGAPGSMAGTLDFLLPGTFPASTSLMTLTSAGAMGHTLAPAVTSLTASGTITATGDMSADEYKITGTKVAVRGAWTPTGAGGVDNSGHNFSSVANDSLWMVVDLTVGDRITNVQAYGKQASAGTLELSLHTRDDSGTLSAAVGSDTDIATGAFASFTLSSLTETVAANGTYVLQLVSSGSGNITGGNVEITYDRP